MGYILQNRPDSLEILVHPDVHRVLSGHERKNLERIGVNYSCSIQITPSTDWIMATYV